MVWGCPIAYLCVGIQLFQVWFLNPEVEILKKAPFDAKNVRFAFSNG